jgi:hypothetical protein
VANSASSQPSAQASVAKEGSDTAAKAGRPQASQGAADADKTAEGVGVVDRAAAFSPEVTAREAPPTRSLAAQAGAQTPTLWTLGAASLLGAATASFVASRKRKNKEKEIEAEQRNELAGALREFEADIDVVDQNIGESLAVARALNEKVTDLNAKIRQSLESGRRILDH